MQDLNIIAAARTRHGCLTFAGHDDALAIMLAAEHPGLRLLGVSTVACNQSIEKTTINALAVLHAIGRSDVPVYRGQHKPLIRPTTHCADIHGETGAPC